jgi:hypothetical protein
MKKTMMLMFAVIFGLLAVFAVTTARADDTDKCASFVEKLVSGSPWHGQIVYTWIVTHDLVFFRENGQLKAKIENGSTTNSRSGRINGPVRFLEIELLEKENCTVSFQNIVGTNYKLGLKDTGNLHGPVTQSTGLKGSALFSPPNTSNLAAPDKK